MQGRQTKQSKTLRGGGRGFLSQQKSVGEKPTVILLVQCYISRHAGAVDTPSPEGRAKSLGDDNVEQRIVLY